VLEDWPAYVAAELIEVICRLPRHRRSRQRCIQLVDWIIRIQRPVAIKLERRSMEIVRSRFRDHIDHRPARASQLRRISVGIDLELLHCVLAELIRRPTRAGASAGLPKE